MKSANPSARKPSFRGAAFCIASLALGGTAFADPAYEQAQFAPDGRLLKPENYREWITIGTGLNMAYGPTRAVSSNRPVFTNVFVAPAAYRAFMQEGKWPDLTVFILEIRSAATVNKTEGGGNGYYQGDILAIEAEVKDEKRFPGGWAFFGMNPKTSSGTQIPTTADCYSCHAKNAAVENTFVQFYPELREVAAEKGTLKKVPEKF